LALAFISFSKSIALSFISKPVNNQQYQFYRSRAVRWQKSRGNLPTEPSSAWLLNHALVSTHGFCCFSLVSSAVNPKNFSPAHYPATAK
jgi:hypothetical protein